jgi:acyl dehydratase
MTIDQERIQRFADATDDHQFIHVDPEKAAESLFGTTVAHGYLTLSLLPHLSQEHSVIPERLLMAINYGLNRVRFLQPVKVGSAVRVRSRILKVASKGPDRVLVTSEATVEIKGEDRPALTAETLALYVVGKAPN